MLTAFSLVWVGIIYFFNSAVAGRFLRIGLTGALLYITTLVLIGIFGEVFVDSIYNFVFGQPLWEYHVAPLHHAYTSFYSLFIWSMYGFHLYLFHTALERFGKLRSIVLASIVAVEAVALELLFNSSYHLLYGDYIFYYLPSDIWHLTSLQAIPFYFLAGLVIVTSLKRFKGSPVFFSIMSLSLVFTLLIAS